MSNLRRITITAGIATIIVLLAGTVIRSKRAAAEAEFISTKTQTITVSAGGVERRALVHLPSGDDGKSPLPIVLIFHGNGGTPEAIAMESGWMPKSDMEKFIVVFPEATRPDMTKPAKFGSNNPAWNDGSGRFHAGAQNVADVAFVTALLDHLEAKFQVDKHRIFATGFSNGASMTFRVGLELSERIASISPVSGALWVAEPKIAQPISLLYITGTADPINPMEGGAPKMASGSGFKGVPEKAKPPARTNITQWANLLGCETDPKPVASNIDGVTIWRYSGGRDGTEVIFTTIAGHGHIWPGAKSSLPEFIIGKATQLLNATDVVWEFFKTHPKQHVSRETNLLPR
jgi:polyhydroxybutyrate depolymerase